MASSSGLEHDFAPWSFWQRAPAEQRADQLAYGAELRARGYAIGHGCVVSRLAAVHPETFSLGDGSYVAAHAHISGDVSIGADCSVNVSAALRGSVRTGRAVRIGAHTSVLGFDHGFADTAVEIFRQPLRSVGVVVGDDVWIGSHVVVLDGVRIGSHAVVGAGSVVTRDVPEWAVVVGNPARVVKDRRGPAGGSGAHDGPCVPAGALRAFAERARAELPAVLDAAWADSAYRDSPSAPPTVRAHCDAVELADLLLGVPPAQLGRAEHIARLRSAQDAMSGLVPELGGASVPGPTIRPGPVMLDHTAAYHVLCVGYALDLLGSAFAHPVTAVTRWTPDQLVQLLDDLPWRSNAWGAGALVDAVGTALTWSLRGGHPLPPGLTETLIGWLVSRQDVSSGLWGSSDDGLREPVNGAYRLLRGTAAQWGLDTGRERTVLDTVLTHAAGVVGTAELTACDALDIAYLAHRVARVWPDHRRAEVVRLAEGLLTTTVAGWRPGRGIAFAPGLEESLQGTEMWLAVAWYAADLLGRSDELGFRPRGVHRPEQALDLRRPPSAVESAPAQGPIPVPGPVPADDGTAAAD